MKLVKDFALHSFQLGLVRKAPDEFNFKLVSDHDNLRIERSEAGDIVALIDKDVILRNHIVKRTRNNYLYFVHKIDLIKDDVYIDIFRKKFKEENIHRSIEAQKVALLGYQLSNKTLKKKEEVDSLIERLSQVSPLLEEDITEESTDESPRTTRRRNQMRFDPDNFPPPTIPAPAPTLNAPRPFNREALLGASLNREIIQLESNIQLAPTDSRIAHIRIFRRYLEEKLNSVRNPGDFLPYRTIQYLQNLLADVVESERIATASIPPSVVTRESILGTNLHREILVYEQQVMNCGPEHLAETLNGFATFLQQKMTSPDVFLTTVGRNMLNDIHRAIQERLASLTFPTPRVQYISIPANVTFNWGNNTYNTVGSTVGTTPL